MAPRRAQNTEEANGSAHAGALVKAGEHKPNYEFFGPPGVTLLTVILPPICYLLFFACNDVTGCPIPSLLHPSTLTLERVKYEIGWQGLSTIFTVKAFVAMLGYYAFSLILFVTLPATEEDGIELREGGKLKYRFNAFSSSMFTLVVAAAGTIAQGADFPLWTFIWDNFVPLFTSNVIIAYALATYVYIRSFEVKPGNKEHREIATVARTGNIVYDWFMGRELNPTISIPTIGVVDIKSWCEIRPGILGWIILDLAYIARQYKVHGYISDSIVITTCAQALYAFDSMYVEPAILSTFDIVTEGFGFMLAFGDLAWLPFTYSLQARYLAMHPVNLGPFGIIAVLSVLGTGYYIFRGTNNEKQRYRANPKDPRVAHLKSIKTKLGSTLLVSGWWGRARHINYLGDWLLSWAYCLPTGLAGFMIDHKTTRSLVGRDSTVIVPGGEARGYGIPVTYFFMLYFAILLIHRERRDEERCRRKYGDDWEEYCKRVPYRIIPYVY